MGISTYLANKLLDHQVGKTSYTMPTVYVALSSTTPTAGGTNVTEPATGGYARQATSGSTWATAASGATTTAEAITWSQASADYLSGANLTYGVLYDASSGGNMLAFGAIATPKNVLTGDTPSIAIGDLDITLS